MRNAKGRLYRAENVWIRASFRRSTSIFQNNMRCRNANLLDSESEVINRKAFTSQEFSGGCVSITTKAAKQCKSWDLDLRVTQFKRALPAEDENHAILVQTC